MITSASVLMTGRDDGQEQRTCCRGAPPVRPGPGARHRPVGADRICRNGDVLNKIGTYALALAAAAHGVPFVVLAPLSTLDPAQADGSGVEVEERAADLRRYLDPRLGPSVPPAWRSRCRMIQIRRIHAPCVFASPTRPTAR